MSVIIHGLNMPKYTTKAEFGIDADGNPLCMVYHEKGTEPDIYDVIPLPEKHCRLIDADALRDDWLHNGANEFVYDANTVIYSIDNAPTIVPAEGGTDDDGNA